MTTLADWDDVLNAVVDGVTVEVMEGEFRLASLAEVGVEPFLRSPTIDHARVAPAVENGLLNRL